MNITFLTIASDEVLKSSQIPQLAIASGRQSLRSNPETICYKNQWIATSLPLLAMTKEKSSSTQLKSYAQH